MYNFVGITLFCLKTKITFDYWYFETQTAENGEKKNKWKTQTWHIFNICHSQSTGNKIQIYKAIKLSLLPLI